MKLLDIIFIVRAIFSKSKVPKERYISGFVILISKHLLVIVNDVVNKFLICSFGRIKLIRGNNLINEI